MQTTVTTTRPQAISALRQMARALSGAWDLDTTLDLIARKTTEVMHVDSCSIYLLDPDGITLRLQASTGLARQAVGLATLKVGEGMTGYAMQSNHPIHATEAQANPLYKSVDEAEEGAFQSLLAVPLTIETEPIGALNVQTIESHQFSPEEIEILALIADLAAGALAKAQLYDRQSQQLREMQAVAAVSEVVTSPQYLDDILDVVTEMAATIMNTAVCSIFLLNEAGTHLELRSAKQTTAGYRYRPPLPVGDGILGRVAATGKPLYVPNVQADDRYIGGELAQREGLVSLLSVPLSVRDHVIGVLSGYTTTEYEFSEKQRALFMTLANQTALAIENARLVTNAAVVREMHHRIKNNLQTVAMLMQLQISDAERLNPREVLETSIHRIRSIAAVHEVLSERGFRLVDVKDVLERITRTTTDTMLVPQQAVQINVYGESILLPSRAATALTLVVNELVQNALEHAFLGQPSGIVEVSLGRSPKEVIVVVRDDGIGLSSDYTRGLGLEIADTLVTEDLNGRMQFIRLERGTEVTLRFPRTIETSGYANTLIAT